MTEKHQPTKEGRELVKVHAMVGTRQEIIAEMLGITDRTLRKHYRKELDFSTAQANATIGGALFNKAKGGDTAAQIFWLKTRAGFRETNNHNLTSEDGSMTPKESAPSIDYSKLSKGALKELRELMASGSDSKK